MTWATIILGIVLAVLAVGIHWRQRRRGIGAHIHRVIERAHRLHLAGVADSADIIDLSGWPGLRHELERLADHRLFELSAAAYTAATHDGLIRTHLDLLADIDDYLAGYDA